MKKNLNEILFAVYLFLFTICKYPIRYLTGFSTIILLTSTLFLLMVSLIYNIRAKERKIYLNKYFIIVIVVVFTLFLITYFLKYNRFTDLYLYEFFIYGIFSMYFFAQVKNYKEFFKYFTNIGVVVIIMYFLDPFNKFYFFSDYMSFGLTCMLPAFCACCIGRILFKKKIYLLFEIISFFEIVIFCNRGAIFVAIALEIVLYIITTKLNIKKILVLVTSLIIGIVIILNIENILEAVIEYLEANKMDSYSVRAMYRMVSTDELGLSGRDLIWDNAIEYYKNSWLFGHGIGAFQSEYGIYTHNIFLEILTSYGTIGMTAFIILVIICIYKIKNSNGYYRIFLTTFFIMGIFPLLLSIYTFKWQYFWCFIISGIKKIPKEYRKVHNKFE